jgi:hypothetical protein
MPDDDEFNAIETINPITLVRVNDYDPILDAEVVELDPVNPVISTMLCG